MLLILARLTNNGDAIMCVFCEMNTYSIKAKSRGIKVSLPVIEMAPEDDRAYIYYKNTASECANEAYIFRANMFVDNSNGQNNYMVLPINYCPYCGKLLRMPLDIHNDIKMYWKNLPNILIKYHDILYGKDDD